MWDQGKRSDSVRVPQDGILTRSTSSNTLNKAEANRLQSMQSKHGLWNSLSNSPGGSLTQANVSGRASAPPQQLRSGKIKSYLSGDRDSSDDESSSDSEAFRARPGTPPKPSILRQIRRSSTSQSSVPLNKLSNEKSSFTSPARSGRRLWGNDSLRSSKSEYNLSSVGRDTPVKLRSSTASGLWSSPGAAQVQNEKIDLAMTNPATIPCKE